MLAESPGDPYSMAVQEDPVRGAYVSAGVGWVTYVGVGVGGPRTWVWVWSGPRTWVWMWVGHVRGCGCGMGHAGLVCRHAGCGWADAEAPSPHVKCASCCKNACVWCSSAVSCDA